MATCNVIVDASDGPLLDKDILHILIPDSFYSDFKPKDFIMVDQLYFRLGFDQSIPQVQQYHLMSNLFPNQTKDGKETHN